MSGALLVLAAVAVAVLAAAATSRRSSVSFVLVAYLAFVANLGVVTLVLSPFHAVTRSGLAVAEAVLLVAAAAAWWLRGRPRPPFNRAALGELVTDPVTALGLAFVAVILVYELVLGLTVPPNNNDALAYHLAKAAAWAQHGGLYWISNAPTVRMNAFQPLAEQQILYFIVATKSNVLIAFPQWLAEVAILLAVYGTSRRLGFAVRPAACGALLLAMFSLIALESTTAQNDIVAGSFPVVAACLMLGAGTLEPVLAGVAVGAGLGVKLTTLLVVPVVAALALIRSRRTVLLALAGGAAGFAALGAFGYGLNLVHTGHVLGSNTGFVEDRASPSYPGSLANGFTLVYGLMDLSVLSNHLIYALAIAGLIAGAATAFVTRRPAYVAGVVIPFVASVLLLWGHDALAWLTRDWGFPIRGAGGTVSFVESDLGRSYARVSNEDYSAFGPVAIAALVTASVVALRSYRARAADLRHVALACTLPFFLIVISATTFWSPFLMRFFIVPVVLAAPLMAHLFRNRLTAAAFLAVGALAIVLTLVHDETKPFTSTHGWGRPWSFNQIQSLEANSRYDAASGFAAYTSTVPPHACVGAVLDTYEPSYLLFGPHFTHKVVYLSVNDAVQAAYAHGLFYVVVSGGQDRWVAQRFRASGWRIRLLGSYWLLAQAPHANAGAGCSI